MANIEVRLRGPSISALLELPGAVMLERVKAQIASKVDIPEGRVCLYHCNPETEERIGEKLRESAVTVAEAAANGYLYVMDSRPPAPVPGPAAGGGGADVMEALHKLAVKQEQQDEKLNLLLAQNAAADALSVVSPSGRQYEIAVNGVIEGRLAALFGLQITPDSRRKITMAEDKAMELYRSAATPPLHPEPFVEWDARLTVAVISPFDPPAVSGSGGFYIYGGHPTYQQPPPPASARQLSPSKGTLEENFFAILEYTARDEWGSTWTSDDGKKHKSLLQRLELRLRKFVQRSRSLLTFPKGTTEEAVLLDCVALAGVVGQYPCSDKVEHEMTVETPQYPLLASMYRSRRFVFIEVTVAMTASTALESSPASGGGSPAGAAAGGAL